MAASADEVEFGGATTREIRSRLRIEAERLRELQPEVKARDRALEPAHLINALFCWYMRHPEPERDEIARSGVTLYQSHRSGAPVLVGGVGGNIEEGGGSAKSRPKGSLSPNPNLERKGRKSKSVNPVPDKTE